MGPNCISPYAFKMVKIYGDSQARRFDAFEVASVGVEYLYKDPLAFERDSDHLRFVLHKLWEV